MFSDTSNLRVTVSRWRWPFPWMVGFFFGDLEVSMDLWTTIAGKSRFDGRVGTVVLLKA